MDDYQKDHAEAFEKIQNHWLSLDASTRSALKVSLSGYLAFRKKVDGFLEAHFRKLCTLSCYQSRLSACCTREGVIVFFADAAVECMVSGRSKIDALMDLLARPNEGFKCVYLGENGCAWHVKPIVCQLFLCGKAEREVLEKDAEAKRGWEVLQDEKKAFTWPDRKVLFDDLEKVFIEAGIDSPLMHFHKSPGLIRVKRLAGLTP